MPLLCFTSSFSMLIHDVALRHCWMSAPHLAPLLSVDAPLVDGVTKSYVGRCFHPFVIPYEASSPCTVVEGA
jgi:hypothetical protein